MRTYTSEDKANVARQIADRLFGFIGYFKLETGQIVVVTTEEIEEEYELLVPQEKLSDYQDWNDIFEFLK